MLANIVLSFALITISIFFTYSAALYTDNYGTNHVVPDLFLDNVPVVDVSYIFFEGAFVFCFIVLMVLIFEPRYIPFVLEASALFFITRSFFMVLTHLSAPSIEYYRYIEHERHLREVIFTLSSGNDLFFSGHTGYPFLLALIFWPSKTMRYFFLASSIVGAVIVLIGHLHYSIDVFSAFFITYGVFEMAKSIFKKEYQMLSNAIGNG